MVDCTSVQPPTRVLRRRFSRFLANHTPWKLPLRKTLRRIDQNDWNAVIFGGVLRDLTLFGNAQLPRDVDVVVAGASSKDLEAAFKDLICDRIRFGGFRLRPRGWLIDIWAL